MLSHSVSLVLRHIQKKEKSRRDVEPLSSFGTPLSNGKLNRDLESVPLTQMERERILSEQRDIYDFFEQTADQAFQGECAAQTRISEAQSNWTEENGECKMLRLLFVRLACSSNLRGWNSTRRIN